MDRTTKLRDSITTLIASNFELVCIKSIFVEGIRIEKTGVRFRSKLRNPSVVGNDPKSSPQKPQNPRNANELPWSKPYALTSSRMTAQNNGPYAQRVDTKRRAFFHKLRKTIYIGINRSPNKMGNIMAPPCHHLKSLYD